MFSKSNHRLGALVALIAALCGGAADLRAQFTFANDNTSTSAYSDGWQNSDNGGSGFGAWTLASGGGTGGFGGNFIGDPNAAGITTFGTNAFAQFANPTNSGAFANADRTLSSAMQVGDTFSFQWAINWDSGTGGNKGFNLYTGGVAGTQLINVNNGSSANITINGADTTFSFGTTVMTWTFAYTGATTLVVTANDRDGSGTYSNSFTVAGAVDAFRFYSSSMQSGNQAQPYFNNFSLTNSGLYNVATAQTESRFLTGSGNLAKTGSGTLTLSGTSNNFTGTVGITNGAIRATAASALGAASAVTVQSGAALEYSGNISVARNLTLNGTGLSTGGALRNISGDNTNSGSITLGSASRINSDAGTLTLSGAVSGSGFGLTVGGAGSTVIQTAIGIGSGGLTKADAGTLTLSGANAYTGGTLVSGGRLIGDTRSLQGTITNTAAVTFSQSTNGTYGGLMSGTGGTLTKSGAGTVTLTANNSYTGATTIGGGRLIVNGSQGSSAVTVSNGASLGGSGTVGALTVSGLVAPGNSIGTLNAGNTVFDGGGSLELEMFNWTSTAGTGWDLLAVTGNLTLSNTSGSPFVINLVSLQDSSTTGLSTNWNQNANFTNRFVTYSGSLLGTAFNSNLFTVNTNGFLNPFNGTFSITNVSGGLALLYTTSFVPSSTYTWNTNSGLWGTAGNWTNGAAPSNGSSIVFAGAGGGASTNSSTVSSIQGLAFSNTAGSYTISGSALAVGAGGISNASTSAQTISNNLSLSANAAITAGAGNVTLAGNLTNGGNAVTVGGAANTTINGVISGSGSLTKSGTGSLSLTAANSYTGATTISGGTVVASSDAALGTTNGATTVSSGAALSLSGGITTAENITITGSGVGGGGAIRSLGDGENTLAGTITLGGDARINVDAPIGSVTTLSSLGSTGFTVSTEFSFIPYTQTSTNLTLTSATGGLTLAGQFGSVYDWNSISTFGLRMSVAGANPDLPFEIILYDGSFSELSRYEATTDGLTNTASVKTLALLSSTSGLDSVEWLEFKWNGDATATSVSLIDIVSVPTSGLVISGDIAGGSNVLTLGSAAAGSGTVADGLRVTGTISGSGNTYGGTTTSVVKDGGGTVYLSGNNSYTGDTRILDGILSILLGSSTNALGTGSDLFISSLGTLQLQDDVSVSSFQGAGVGDAGNVVLDNNSALTVNGAGKTMTMAGVISGDGGLRIAGNASTKVTLTANNTFQRNTTVTAGTLELAGTGGNQALGSTGPVTVGSSGKLLLSTSDQVRDFASVTLSGGTIERASGVSEVFGNLNLTTASFLDYGTGATGTLRFGTYTPSSLLTVQNFLPGNKLQFGSTLTQTQLDNPSLFAFSSGFTTGTEGGFFTITAIPEPSTYLAAAGLVAVIVWPSRRRILSEVRKVIGVRG